MSFPDLLYYGENCKDLQIRKVGYLVVTQRKYMKITFLNLQGHFHTGR